MGTYAKARETTKQNIMNAFWNLYETNTIDKITIKMITDACNIHRATFYIYYHDVFEVLEEIEDKLLNEMCVIRAENNVNIDNFDTYATLIFKTVRKNQKYIRRLVINSSDPDFSIKYKKKLIEILLSIFNESNLTEKSRTTLEIVNFASIDIILSMTDSGLYSVDEIICLVKGIMLRGVFPTIKNHFDLVPVEAALFI